MEKILKSIVDEYEKLLDSYEKMCGSFKAVDYKNVEDYIKTLDESGHYVVSISDTQDRIENLRNELKKSIENDLLIDGLIEEFSGGRIGHINERIRELIGEIKSYEEKGRTVLNNEMKSIEKNLGNINVWHKGVKYYNAAPSVKESMFIDKRK